MDKNIAGIFHDINEKIFLEMNPCSSNRNGSKNKQRSFPLVNSFFIVKENINIFKRHPVKWEEICTQYTTDKELTCEIYKKTYSI